MSQRHATHLSSPRTARNSSERFAGTRWSWWLRSGRRFGNEVYGSRPIHTLRWSTAEWRINTNPISHRLWAQDHRDQCHRRRSDRSRRPRAQKNWAWQEALEQIRVKSRKDLWEVLLLKMWMNLEKLVLTCLTSSHRCIPNTIRRKASQTRTPKMENYEKCWLHHCICRILSNANRNWETIVTGERSAKRVQAGLMSSSSQEPSAPGKPAALFSFGSEEPGNQFKSSVFKNADPSNLGWSLLKGNRDHLLNQAKSELMRQEQQVGSVNNCISELQQQPCAQRLELQDAQHGYIESRRDQVRLQEQLSQIRSMHEMGEMWRAQELRVDEVSVQRLEKIMRRYRRSRPSCRKCKSRWIPWLIRENFKKWNQITKGDCLKFSSQPAMIPSSRSMTSRDKRLLLDTCFW